MLGPSLRRSWVTLLSNGTRMGGRFVNAGTDIESVVVPSTSGSGSGLWVAAAIDDGYLKMCLINVTVFGGMAYAYVSGARMTDSQDATWTTQRLQREVIAVNNFYFGNSFVCMSGAFGVCTMPVSTANGNGFGISVLDYSIIGPPTSQPTSCKSSCVCLYI